ncbi:uncharacterized protein EI97DRAFT_162968 [Westerdykella ornata]|uniref:Camp independent regulatory protein n=1 Tax=Westerdykella ornata TaxID=318751 RepID=A0A6A6JDA4_WESOR|nr:uncharacterized protein EI97DRAFT_162968 [Westerdykella ornata]KAF2273179.1 hypothetical protein EI97DRAFT_162968 [Westerdykella ornata]
MLQGIRASTLTVPSFGHSLSLTGVQKMESYGDVDPWSWATSQPGSLAQGYGPIFDQSLYSSTTPGAHHLPHSLPPRHHSIPGSHVATSSPVSHAQTPTPPPARQHSQVSGSLIKAQPAFKPTWHGFLDTTRDAMTIVEAALQGRLNHISRRPHDKERAEMLTSGTVLVYEENASGIKRWTDAVHWSPSRVMNNCLIYRQLTRALRPDEKKSALNPSCGNKRKRKESATPAINSNGEIVHVAEDEYEHATMEVAAEENSLDPLDKVYANFAQRLTPEQQRRFCGSLIDSYEFKEGGLMKKTISVKYQGTHHHVISYYTLEDVVEGKLKRPCEDPNLADIQPRPELLDGWKVSLEDEESRDSPVYGGYPQTQPASFAQPSAPAHRLAVETQTQTHSPVNMAAPSEYWAASHVQQYTPSQQTPRNYASTSTLTSPYAQQVTQDYPVQQNPMRPVPSDYPLQQPPVAQYQAPAPAVRQYPQPPSNQTYPQQPSSLAYPAPQGPPTQHYSTQPSQGPSPTSHYQSPPPATQQFTSVISTPTYADPHTPSSYSAPGPMPLAQPSQYTMPQAQAYDMPVQVQPHASSQPAHSSFQQHDSHGRGSVSVNPQPYSQAQTQPSYTPSRRVSLLVRPSVLSQYNIKGKHHRVDKSITFLSTSAYMILVIRIPP